MLSQRVERFTESVIRGMTRECNRYGGVNLAQGFPDFDGPEEVKEAARRAVAEGWNQYAITWGNPGIRRAIARKAAWYNGIEVDPEEEITVVCGATEGMIATLMAVLNPGDEAVIFEPFYENYGPDTVLSGSVPRFVPLHPPDFTFDPGELRGAFGPATRAIIVNTPHNPTGHVFTRGELETIRDLCVEFDALAVTDEVYEHILFDGRRHLSLAALEGMRERTVTINSLSKTYSVTGWRVGYVLAPKGLTSGIRKVHDFLTVGAPAPLQEAAAVALSLPEAYYANLAAMYQGKRDLLQGYLQRAEIPFVQPQGAYYVMADISGFGCPDDAVFAMRLIREHGVAAVPGSSFYHTPGMGRDFVRFTFSKKEETLHKAGERLLAMARG
ncbi:MAG: aminotransferase class I/II-fold pyridoxal phosphate-dependent enzyme [Candidatus Tectomicrobia bacterium]|nr:aminotransferase class I/II-fold pyridoxal phosphate-dependent enzyme [Candidatus Tectomicrobia bacterium]